MRTAVLLLLAAAAPAGELANAESAVQKVARAVRPAVVTVITPNPRDADVTGVVIGPGGIVLTVRSPLLTKQQTVPQTVPIRFPGKKVTIDGELIDHDPNTDTALFRASGARARAISIGRAADVIHGMWVLLVGNTFGQGRESTPTLSLGTISGIARERDEITFFHSSAMVNPGSIGAPIIDLSGDLIGIAAPRVTEDGQQTIIVPYDRIRASYREAGRKGSRVVGREPPPRRLRNHIADVFGPVLEDTGKRASRALVAVRGLSMPSDKAKEEAWKKKVAEAKEKKRRLPPRPRRVPGAFEAYDRSSGLIVDAKGLVLCPLRVTGWPGDTRPLKVDLMDGQSFDATLLGTDERLRLALLRISAGKLPVLEPAPPESHRAGYFAIALGYPHARPGRDTPQMTVGIVSRTRALAAVHPAFRAVQTDAAISATNRGGPLVDIDGRMLGVILDVNDTDRGGYASKGRGRFTGNAGLGFAVPWSVLKDLVPKLEQGVVLKPAMLGVNMVETPTGLLVVNVAEHNSKKEPTGAKTAGIVKGDRIVAIDGEDAMTMKALQKIMGALTAGRKAKVTIRRGEKRLDLEVTFTEP